MGKKEAYCTQCGSLINIDDSKDKNKCLFCGAEIVTEKALKLNDDTESRLLIQKAAEQKAKEEAKDKKKDQPKSAKNTQPAVPAQKEIIVMKPLPLKTKIIIFASLIAVVAILSGIFVPTITIRNQKRSLFEGQITGALTYKLESYAFKYNDNREFVVATSSELSRPDAEKTYNAYASMYTDAYGISETSAQKKLSVKIYAKNGLYSCDKKSGTLNVSFTTATPTPTMTPAVTSTASSSK